MAKAATGCYKASRRSKADGGVYLRARSFLFPLCNQSRGPRSQLQDVKVLMETYGRLKRTHAGESASCRPGRGLNKFKAEGH
jgi:hypothetical protein